jgi:hypothetical protein
MPQLSLYIDRETLKKIDKSAKLEHTSISKWVGKSIRKFLNEEYPADYFTLFGSISDPSLKVQKSVSFSDDSKREVI